MTVDLDAYGNLAHPVDLRAEVERYKVLLAELAAERASLQRTVERYITMQGETFAKFETAERQTNEAYRQRNLAASLACRLAVALGIPAGVRIDTEQPAEWATLIQIDLPAGQVSWHVHQRESAVLTGLPIATAPWDGHTAADRDARCVAPILKCEDCSKVGAVMQSCPYAEEIHGDKTEVPLCERCAGSRAADI